jgi:hypothetical protein
MHIGTVSFGINRHQQHHFLLSQLNENQSLVLCSRGKRPVADRLGTERQNARVKDRLQVYLPTPQQIWLEPNR